MTEAGGKAKRFMIVGALVAGLSGDGKHWAMRCRAGAS